MEKYFAVDDRNRRLHRTICLYNGRPVYVYCADPSGATVNQDDEVFISELKAGLKGLISVVKVKYTDEAFQARAFPLGYINHTAGATYLARTPTQQQRQGLHADIVDAIGGDNLPPNWFMTSEMSDCIEGVHPSFKEALDSVKKEGRSRSFDRFWAISPHHKTVFSLQFRGRPVGMVGDFGKITLFEGKERRLLIQMLREKGLTV